MVLMGQMVQINESDGSEVQMFLWFAQIFKVRYEPEESEELEELEGFEEFEKVQMECA